MRLFERQLREWDELIGKYASLGVRVGDESNGEPWDTRENQLVLRQDAAVELGGGSCPALSLILYTEDRGQERSETFLYGPDLRELSGNVPFARVVLAGIKEDFLREEFKRYQLFRSIEYIRYRVSPRGYMPRISTAQHREQVRVSGEAVREGITFQKAGEVYRRMYCAHPAVSWVRQYFITLADFDYRGLQRIAESAEAEIMSLDHPLNDLRMDCASCNLRIVCDEVDLLCKKEESGSGV